MNRFLIGFILLSICHWSYGAADDIRVEQRNNLNTGWIYRILPSPPTDGFLTYNATTIEPEWVTLGASCSISNGVLDCNGLGNVSWSSISGKPGWASSFDGSYSTLLGSAPVTSVQGQSGSVTLTASDVSAAPIAHSHVATSISDSTSIGRSLMTAPNQSAARSAIGAGASNFSGSYADLTSIPSSFPPSAHSHTSSQITDSTAIGRSILTAIDQQSVKNIVGVPAAVSQLSNDLGYLTSTSLSGYATTLALSTGLAAKYNSPSCPTSQYIRGDGSCSAFPSIPLAQVNSDWNSTSGVSQILNKPVKYSGAPNSSGVYSVTYPAPYSSTPHVVITVVGGTNKDSAVLTSTASGFSVLLERRADVLGLLPSYSPITPASNPAATVNVTVTP